MIQYINKLVSSIYYIIKENGQCHDHVNWKIVFDKIQYLFMIKIKK